MKYTQYPNGLIRCEDDKCGEWHYGGHDLQDILPTCVLENQKGEPLCIGCGKHQHFNLLCKIKTACRMVVRKYFS